MDGATQQSFSETASLSGFERQAQGGEVRIVLHGRPVLTFSEADPVSRDFVIVMLLEVGLRGQSVARLCGMSEAHVTGVRQRAAAGGVGALAERGRSGRPKKLTARKLTRLRKLNAQGLSMSAIGRELGVHHSTVTRTLAGLGLERGAPLESETLPLVGGVGSAADFTPRAPSVASERVAQEGRGPAAGKVPVEPESTEIAVDSSEELQPGAELPVGPTEHPSRYAATVLLAAAMAKLGVGYQAYPCENAR